MLGGQDSNTIKLDDAQISRFICDGILLLDSAVDSNLHGTIRKKLEWVNKNDRSIEGNIIPRIPELQAVLDSPVIKGAIQSLLGNDFFLHPHRIVVPSEPLSPEQRSIKLSGNEDGPPMGEGSNSYSYWHKDTYIPLGQARYHAPFRLFLFYFPQDTPFEMGPTRVIPGSQYQDAITAEDHEYALVPDGVKAGSCLLAAFDIDHAGMSNRADQTRYMIKFNFLRTGNPKQPSWNGGTDSWQAPTETLGRYSHPKVWSTMWDWLRGHTQTDVLPPQDIPLHVSRLNSSDQPRRLEAIYTLGAMGPAALAPLLESLSSVEGQGRIDPPYVQNEDGSYSVNAVMEAQRRWTEGGYIFQDEAYALGRLGEVAIDPLRQLLQSKDPWIVINAAFALGQIGHPAARAIDDLTVLLDSADHRVLRAILESIACIGSNTEAALPAIKKILRTDRETWHQDTDLPYLVGDQIHFNAALALLSSDLPIMVMEDFLLELLERPADRNFVQAIALEVLLRNPSESSLPKVLKYLQVHCWDDTEMSY